MNTEENIKQELIIINNKLDRILGLIETDCKKMSSHIDFIEDIYTKIKSPFGYLMESVNKIIKPDDVKNNLLDK